MLVGRVLLGKGDGTFQSLLTSNGSGPVEFDPVQAGDFNRDGKLDLAAVDSGSSTLRVFPGNGDGTLQNQMVIALLGIPGSPPRISRRISRLCCGRRVYRGRQLRPGSWERL